MKVNTYLSLFFLLQFVIINSSIVLGQHIPIIDYSTNTKGQVQLLINSNTEHYYILKTRLDSFSSFEFSTSMTIGEAGTTVITEPLGRYPIERYQVLEYPIQSPADTDGDGINDMIEYGNRPIQNPLNAGESIPILDGLVTIESPLRFKELAIKKDIVPWSEYLNDKAFLKFVIEDFDTENPKLYFINSATYSLHLDFTIEMGIDYFASHVIKGHIIYHPTIVSNNGSYGSYAFNYSNGESKNFETVQKTQELLAINMPFLENNLSYFVNSDNEDEYEEDLIHYQNSRVSVLHENDVYAELNYWGLNQAEGFGFFHRMSMDEIPGLKDIVLYDFLPNFLPRVGGIMTSFIQTPLSHVNLRAIQDNIPNAFVRDPLSNDTILNLLNHYIYYKVEADQFIIREASLDEVNHWFEDIRPNSIQEPPLNLDYIYILPLDDITFSMYDAYGAKCSNLASMRTFGFPDGTIPNGFGIPFYYYQEFMVYNHLFEEIESIMNDSEFKTDRAVRNDRLKAFRKKIKKAEMPTWMLNDLESMHLKFPSGTSIRCRSSSNNEDLSGFSGAGLYESKTHHPHEGHISKTIKQVYASLWNLRAFDERAFYRVNHFTTAMGVLCHSNFSDEKVNGVAVSKDPVYHSLNTFYLNSQMGEDLITNPDASSLPEEILLDEFSQRHKDYTVIKHSNLIPADSLLMAEPYLDKMRNYLSVIHDAFEQLYHAVNNNTFAVDIEYKITSDDQLIIKQARPWVSYKSEANSELVLSDVIDFKIFPNPAENYINLQCENCNITEFKITNILGRLVKAVTIKSTNNALTQISILDLSPGVYVIAGFSEKNNKYYSKKFIKKLKFRTP